MVDLEEYRSTLQTVMNGTLTDSFSPEVDALIELLGMSQELVGEVSRLRPLAHGYNT